MFSQEYGAYYLLGMPRLFVLTLSFFPDFEVYEEVTFDLYFTIQIDCKPQGGCYFLFSFLYFKMSYHAGYFELYCLLDNLQVADRFYNVLHKHCKKMQGQLVEKHDF